MSNLLGEYCNSLKSYSRLITREVNIGNVGLGGLNPIRIQSMTTTNTLDTKATVEQTIRMVDAGCEYVRITAPSIKEANNLENIKKELKFRGYDVPLIADIHFTPNAAEAAARIIEKVRINPGNYVDKKKFQQINYTDLEYQQEIERIQKRLLPLIKVCKEYGTAMRIGTNHGSLSDRILSRYGDTPLGMVESAMEFIKICANENYHNLVISMKSSNPKVMVQAYRLLVNRMNSEGMNYPLHLGVTEAGDGEDGRIKSAAGIGALLNDGIGDTIRVSLTEAPEFEIPVAKSLVDRYNNIISSKQDDVKINFPDNFSPYSYSKRNTHSVLNIGSSHVPVVISDLSKQNMKDIGVLEQIGYKYNPVLDKIEIEEESADYAFVGDELPSFGIPDGLKVIVNYNVWSKKTDIKNIYPVFANPMEYLKSENKHSKLNFVNIDAVCYDKLCDGKFDFYNHIKNETNVVLLLRGSEVRLQRLFYFDLIKNNVTTPVISIHNLEFDDIKSFSLGIASDIGSLIFDGFSDGIWIKNERFSQSEIKKLAFGCLQSTRSRISKTEYISCPSCGRTLFDLEEVTRKIRQKTEHLKGLKIGIMGCIVNGPGEMADADYGYVGTGEGVITLYKKQNVVKRNVPSENAVDELISLIKENGDWVDSKKK